MEHKPLEIKNGSDLKAETKRNIKKILDRLITIRINLNEALNMPYDGDIMEMIYTELDKLSDYFIEINKALFILDENPKGAINSIRNIDKEAERSCLNVWNILAVEAKNEFSQRTKSLSLFFVDSPNIIHFKGRADQFFISALRKHEHDDYEAINGYKKCIKEYQKASISILLKKRSTKRMSVIQWITLIASLIAITLVFLQTLGGI